jgi:hypothetical protein
VTRRAKGGLRKEIPVTFALVETKPAVEAPVIEFVLTTGDCLRIRGDAPVNYTVQQPN